MTNESIRYSMSTFDTSFKNVNSDQRQDECCLSSTKAKEKQAGVEMESLSIFETVE